MKRFCIALLFLMFCSVPAHAATYTVGHDAMWPPFEFMNKDNTVVGYTVDYINAVGREAGFSVTSIHVPWDGIFAHLKRGQIQIIASSVTVTEERKKNFLFSEPYFETYQHLLLPKDSDAASLTDMKTGVIGVQTGTTGQHLVNSHKGLTARLYDDLVDAINALARGELAGVVCDYPVAWYYANTITFKDAIKPAPFPLDGEKEEYGFVVAKDDTALQERLNQGIRAVKKKGIDKEIYTKWFGEGTPVH